MEKTGLTPVPRLSLVESTINAIRSLIDQRVWKVGQCIPKEAELAEQLAVGRNTVREAIRVLSHSGMLEVRQGDGTYVRRELDPAQTVSKLNRSGLRDHIELQCLLESEAARFAARRRTTEDIARLKAALDARGEYTTDGDLDAFLDLDRNFHGAIATASHNEALQALYAYFSASIRSHTRSIFADAALPEPSLADHHAILAAIVAGDEEGAASAARNMLEPLIKTLDELLGTRPSNAKLLDRIGITFWK
ncbi:FadR/GntR family transcriptional regulator [Pseudomonas oryzihabitans]|uniref:FadR/GntR family transcriptional regulator n=1 Tax=Pseudomonas oryzihabitans TaxID=47885 RepID=UPI00123BF46F|nr:FadR/GntR family transcriptional regulator [Pseudomonas oryzihabitans]QEU01842.1 FadR family transcriptional regulator [Pseudomonas oryzihabitans]